MAAPYIQNSGAVAAFEKPYDYDLLHAHSDSAYACARGGSRAQQAAAARLPCGEAGVVASCPRVKSQLDTWVTGYNNSIYAVNAEANFPWPEKSGRHDPDRYAWQPKLLTCKPDLMKEMSLGGMKQWNDGGGAPIANVYGLSAPPCAFQANVYGLSEEQAVCEQRAPPPRWLREPRAGTWIR